MITKWTLPHGLAGAAVNNFKLTIYANIWSELSKLPAPAPQISLRCSHGIVQCLSTRSPIFLMALLEMALSRMVMMIFGWGNATILGKAIGNHLHNLPHIESDLIHHCLVLRCHQISGYVLILCQWQFKHRHANPSFQSKSN